MVDFVAKRYGILPSELLIKGNSYDVMIAETSVGYENYLHNKDKGGNVLPTPPSLSQEEMLAMIERVRKNES